MEGQGLDLDDQLSCPRCWKTFKTRKSHGGHVSRCNKPGQPSPSAKQVVSLLKARADEESSSTVSTSKLSLLRQGIQRQKDRARNRRTPYEQTHSVQGDNSVSLYICFLILFMYFQGGNSTILLHSTSTTSNRTAAASSKTTVCRIHR